MKYRISCHFAAKTPLSLLTTFAASSPKGTPFGAAAKFPATAKAVPLGKVASPQAMTEGVVSGKSAKFAGAPEAPSQRELAKP